eukprot:335875-Amphidinium_carterae.1
MSTWFKYIVELSQDEEIQRVPPTRVGAASAACDSVDEVHGGEVELGSPVLHTMSRHCCTAGPKMLQFVAHLGSKDLGTDPGVATLLGQVSKRLEQTFACSPRVELH